MRISKVEIPNEPSVAKELYEEARGFGKTTLMKMENIDSGSTVFLRYRTKTFVFDIDGVLCTYNVEISYKCSAPIEENIKLVNKLHALGHRIILNTSRPKKVFEAMTLDQLKHWDVKYDELYFNKPLGDYYIDDRGVSTDNIRGWLFLGREGGLC